VKTNLRLEDLEYRREGDDVSICKWLGAGGPNPEEQGYTLARWMQTGKEWCLVFEGTQPLWLGDGERALLWQLIEFGYADLGGAE